MNDIIGVLTPPSLNTKVARVLKLNWRLTIFEWRDHVLSLLWEPALIFLIFIVFMEKTILGNEAQSYVKYALPGLASMLTFLSAFVSSAQTTFDRFRLKKAYHQWSFSPLSLEEIATGEIVWSSLRATLMGLIFLMWAWAFGYGLGQGVLFLPLIWLGSGVIAAGLGMIVGLKSTRFTQVNLWYLCLILPLVVLSDTIVEAGKVHIAVDFLIELFPLAYVNQLARASLSGELTSRVFLGAAYLLVASVVMSRLAIRDFVRGVIPNR